MAVNPLRPVKNVPIDYEKAQAWVGAHPDEATRKAAEEILQSIRYVDQETFERDLRRTVLDVNAAIEGPYLSLISRGKSNQWVMELALAQGAKLPENVIDFDDAKGLEQVLRANPDITELVLFDDATYSGSQLSSHVRETERLVEQFGRKVRFHIVVPYISSYAYKELSNNPAIVIHNHERVLTFDEMVDSAENKETILAMYPELTGCIGCGDLSTRRLIYFQHKVADSLSIIEAVYQGEVRGRDGKAVKNVSGNDVTVPFIPSVVTPYKVWDMLDFVKMGQLEVEEVLPEERIGLLRQNEGVYIVQLPERGDYLVSQIAVVRRG